MLLFNCSEAIKTTFSDINISTENNNIVEVTIPKAFGNTEITNSINYEIEKLVINALIIGEQSNIQVKTIEESIIAFNQEYDTFKADFPESLQIWEAQIDGEILLQSSEITSISITSYVNTGGAHGVLNISFLNFNSITGKQLLNKDLFTDIAGFKAIAQTYFNKAIKENDVVFDQNKFELPTNIGYTDDGLVLLYNTYEIAPYSTGIIEFAIPFKAIESYLVFNSAD
ncbi:MAG: DUF3298 domain-containing protein [Flavobacteriaceae bacterium]